MVTWPACATTWMRYCSAEHEDPWSGIALLCGLHNVLDCQRLVLSMTKLNGWSRGLHFCNVVTSWMR